MGIPITIGRRRFRPPQLRLRWRRNVNTLTPAQLARFRAAWAQSYELDDDRGFAHHAGQHGLPLPIECPHGGALFLPWHRAYLYFFELALREIDPTVTIPWWSWASGRLPDAYTDPDPDNPLTSGPIPPAARIQGGGDHTFRTGPTDLPTQADINDALGRDDFLDFSEATRSLHNWVHGSIGGSMGSIGNAAYDPIFWAHHSYVDRMWRLWQLRHSAVSLPPSLLGQALAPFPMTVQQTLSVEALGYDYARATVSIPGPAAPPRP
ncbi:MAG: tyrosinase family protein [Actinomycetota bacterium]|nr:tyrosinase family protein [Actinomycetota bacterium]